MKILVVDDEPPSRARLRRLLAETDSGHQLAGEATDGWEAIACCRSQPIDLVLMDTQMPGMTGLEAARQLARLDSPPAIILMTTVEQAISSALERQVAGCLLKPVLRERLEEVLRRASHLTETSRAGSRVVFPVEPSPGRRRQISARYRGGVRSVPVRDVIYLRADHKYVTARHLDGELLVEESLRSLEIDYSDLFLRIHRNALVARRRLDGLEKVHDGSVQVRLLECDERLRVSRRNLARIRQCLREGGNEFAI